MNEPMLYSLANFMQLYLKITGIIFRVLDLKPLKC